MLTAKALEWLEERAVDPELASKLGIESLQPAVGGREELVFPFFVNEQIVNRKYRGVFDKTFRQQPGGTSCFWNFNALLDPTLANEALIITEGEFDALAAIQCGYARTVSVPSGAPSGPEGEKLREYAYLEHAKDVLKPVKSFILATDGDAPGQYLMQDLALRLGRARCKIVKYPKDCKDLNEVLARYGERGVHETIRRATDYHIEGLYTLSELPPYEERQKFSIAPWLDNHWKVRMGDFSVITGIPGHGKSTFMNDVMCRLATNHGWRIAVASFEQHPRADHLRSLRSWYLNGPLKDAFGNLIVSDDALAAADAWIEKHFVFIHPREEDLTNLEWCLDMCASAARQKGCRMVVIDPWNELDHSRPSDMSLTEYTGTAIKQFKLLARANDIHVTVVAHPTKLAGNTKPTLYSISDSAHWYNKADVGIVVHKQDPGNEFADIDIQKSRYHDEIGRPGIIPVRFSPATRRFEFSPRPVTLEVANG
jgi:twinkle protein